MERGKINKFQILYLYNKKCKLLQNKQKKKFNRNPPQIMLIWPFKRNEIVDLIQWFHKQVLRDIWCAVCLSPIYCLLSETWATDERSKHSLVSKGDESYGILLYFRGRDHYWKYQNLISISTAVHFGSTPYSPARPLHEIRLALVYVQMLPQGCDNPLQCMGTMVVDGLNPFLTSG